MADKENPKVENLSFRVPVVLEGADVETLVTALRDQAATAAERALRDRLAVRDDR